MNSKYRVEELNGKFKIQILTKKIEFVPFGKNRIIDEWVNAGCDGKAALYHRFSSNELKPFDDLESALNQVQIFNKGVKYHYPENN